MTAHNPWPHSALCPWRHWWTTPIQPFNRKFKIVRNELFTNLPDAFLTGHTSCVAPTSGLSYPVISRSEVNREDKLSVDCPESPPIFRALSGNVRWLRTPVPVLSRWWRARFCTSTGPPNRGPRSPRSRPRWRRASRNKQKFYTTLFNIRFAICFGWIPVGFEFKNIANPRLLNKLKVKIGGKYLKPQTLRTAILRTRIKFIPIF